MGGRDFKTTLYNGQLIAMSLYPNTLFSVDISQGTGSNKAVFKSTIN